MDILEFFKIKFTSGKRALDSLTTVNERLEHAKAQLLKKKKLLEKHATAIHENVKNIEFHIQTASTNASQALAHAEAFLKAGDEVNAKLQYKQYETANKAKTMYESALEKAKAAQTKVDETVSNYDIMVGDVNAKICELKTLDEINKVTDFTSDDAGIPTDVSEFLTKIEEDIRCEGFHKEAKAEVAALSKVSTVKVESLSKATSDANFEKFKAGVLRR